GSTSSCCTHTIRPAGYWAATTACSCLRSGWRPSVSVVGSTSHWISANAMAWSWARAGSGPWPRTVSGFPPLGRRGAWHGWG
ncbi:hypothetical protein NY997_14620, partial [Escherichia coli]|uniref:hypothetical protein n=1 Tax=Escherichia coli TaxID=562 RepID=UPI0022F02B75